MPIDLSKLRQERAAKRAAVAEREARADGEPIILDGKEIAVLPPELPFGVIKPLRKINDEIALILRQALRMQQGGQVVDGIQLVLDLLSTNAQLPETLVEVVHDMGKALLGEDGLAQLLATPDLSLPDIAALVGGIFNHFGASLGESSRSVASSQNADPNSEPTSPASTDATTETSTVPSAIPASSDSSTS
jgi:hypothetical protein